MNDSVLRELERRAVADPTDATKALAYVAALARAKEPPTCAIKECAEPVAGLYAGRRWTEGPDGRSIRVRPVGPYCQFHGDREADEGGPEYTASCPACGCRFGVN